MDRRGPDGPLLLRVLRHPKGLHDAVERGGVAVRQRHQLASGSFGLAPDVPHPAPRVLVVLLVDREIAHHLDESRAGRPR